jgi:hypothetical protein
VLLRLRAAVAATTAAANISGGTLLHLGAEVKDGLGPSSTGASAIGGHGEDVGSKVISGSESYENDRSDGPNDIGNDESSGVAASSLTPNESWSPLRTNAIAGGAHTVRS